MVFVHTLYTADRIIDDMSITRAGRFGLPKYFLQLHGIREGMRAYLYWDEGNEAVAVRFAATDDRIAYPIHFTGKYGAFINALRFFRANRLDPMQYRGRYSYMHMAAKQVGITDVQGDVLVVELRKPRARHATDLHALPQPAERSRDGYS